jgi:ribose transport system substrate-binding protein
MLERTGRRGPIAVQTGSATAHGAVRKLQGFAETMTKAGIKVVGGDNDRERLDEAAANARRILIQNPDVRGFYGVYGYHASVQAAAVDAAARSGEVVVVGNDMLPETAAAIRRGSVACSIWIREYYFGYYAATAVATMLRVGEDHALTLFGLDPDRLETNQRRLEPMVVSVDNVATFDTWASRTHVFERTGASQSGQRLRGRS